jgi:hypothetical protein
MSGKNTIMNITIEVCSIANGRWYSAVAGLTLMSLLSAMGGDIQVPLLKTRTGNYTNVTVMGNSKTDIFVSYARGLANIKINDLDPETLAPEMLGLLGMSTPPARASASTQTTVSAKHREEQSPSVATGKSLSLPGFVSSLKGKVPSGLATLERLSSVRLSNEIVLIALGMVVGAYLFICYCLKLICQKAGQAPGLMLWCPILQMFPLLRAAGMSGWWLLGFLIPLVNIVAGILWSFKIVEARGKSSLVAVFLILPFTSLFALLYLAFSNGVEREKETDRGEVPLGPLLVEA